ncbi:hypothetical protein [Nocardia sp. alder85J]|nr:hypothetical protein [Nocardia sp. alder85J]MCX4096159.1 hypothetical protein [Nocardia sp. alder85J]
MINSSREVVTFHERHGNRILFLVFSGDAERFRAITVHENP